MAAKKAPAKAESPRAEAVVPGLDPDLADARAQQLEAEKAAGLKDARGGLVQSSEEPSIDPELVKAREAELKKPHRVIGSIS
jgi:hypothetical protein